MDSGAELIFYVVTEMGHIVPEVEFARRLTSLNPQISISILIPKLPFPHESLDAFIKSLDELRRDSGGRISIVELPPVDDAPPGFGHPVVVMDAYATLYKPIVKRFVEERRLRRKIAGIVFDTFGSPMVDVAEELGVPAYLFFVGGITGLSMFFHLESLFGAGVDVPAPFDGLPPESTPVNFPGIKNPFPLKFWPQDFVKKERSLWPHLMRFASKYRKAKGLLVNTFAELEPGVLRSMNDDERIPPVYAVGPFLKLGNGSSTESGRDPALSWLDGQPAGSVVFLCFGSKIGCFEKDQMEQLAIGIEKSGHRFLWSVRAPNDVFPEGFLDRTAGRGKIIGWASQVDVLAHVAVGAFLSHCGWNSVLESLWYGVPMVTWSMYAEHQLNAFIIVKELEMAVDLKMDYVFNLEKRKGSPMVEAAEVEEAIRRVMEREEGAVARKKTKEMSEIERKVVEEGGSSYASLSCFLEHAIKNVL